MDVRAAPPPPEHVRTLAEGDPLGGRARRSLLRHLRRSARRERPPRLNSEVDRHPPAVTGQWCQAARDRWQPPSRNRHAPRTPPLGEALVAVTKTCSGCYRPTRGRRFAQQEELGQLSTGCPECCGNVA